MKYTNMIVWQSHVAEATADAQIDCYSTVDHFPVTQENSYTTTVTTNMDSYTNTFISTRPLSVTGSGTYYEIPLDQNIKMVYSFLPDSDGDLHYHERNFGFFNIELNSQTGSCTRLSTQQRIMSIHGWLMWFSWTLIGMF